MFCSLNTPKNIKTKENGKEYNSFLVIKYLKNTFVNLFPIKHGISPEFSGKRTPLCTSRCKGSITVEAALILPIYFFSILCVLYLLEITSIQMTVRMGMQEAMSEMVKEAGTTSYLSQGEMERSVVAAIGTEFLDHSIIINGSSGLDCSKSSVSKLSGLVRLQAEYGVQLPIPKFMNLGLNFSESMQAKSWTGYVAGVIKEFEKIVYITENQSVYHMDYQCSYLQLQINSTTLGHVQGERNEYGGVYAPCGLCITRHTQLDDKSVIYITKNGGSYHSTLNCGGLKRTIYSVPLSDVIGKGVCSRCGK